jgi:hypothetical protein
MPTPKARVIRAFPDAHCSKTGDTFYVYSKRFGMFIVPVLGSGKSAAAAWTKADERVRGM